MATAVILLAAGRGTRMRSTRPKVLHTLAGAPLLAHALATAAAAAPERVVVVTGHGAEAVGAAARAINPEVRLAHQAEQLGTGHAVRQALPELEGFDGDVVVLYGDTPLIRTETIEAMLAARASTADIVVLGFEASDPARYGRLKLAPDGSLEAIVEANEADDGERAITICNSGVIAADRRHLEALLPKLDHRNAKGEYYLTDIVGLARAEGLTARAIVCPEPETLGVNSRADLAVAEAVFQAHARARAMENGATLTDPRSVFFAFDTELAEDVTVGPNVVFGPGVVVGRGATIHSFCHLTGCRIGPDCEVGPFARMRPSTVLHEGAKVGNFVEIKNAFLDPGVKVNHLSYIGDADIGSRANIGAGTITCNYDGVFKHRTEIGASAFIGSNTSLVAPVRLGDGVVIGAGSVITSDVEPGALAIARARQVDKAGLGQRLMDRLRALKSKGMDR
jgi:bifunctional UDP-N-acetylglucosamine pyrophosphorylase/glucosamine-1-phosphate N-acetyltransferase